MICSVKLAIWASVSALGLSLLAPAVHAEIYKHVDENGHVTYSNVPTKGAKKLDLEPLTTISSPKAKNPGPENFPKIDNSTQKRLDENRRKILEQELAQEQKQLDDAKQALADGEATRQGGERNYQKYLDRVQKLKDDVTLHQTNIEQLKKEMTTNQ